MRNHTFRPKKKKKMLSSAAPKAAGTCGDLGHQAVENRWSCWSEPWCWLPPLAGERNWPSPFSHLRATSDVSEGLLPHLSPQIPFLLA